MTDTDETSFEGKRNDTIYAMSVEDAIAYEETFLPNEINRYSNFDEQEYYGRFADEIIEQQSKQYGSTEQYSAKESGRDGRSSEVLPTEESNDGSGISESDSRQPGRGVGDGLQSNNPQETLSESTSGGDVVAEADKVEETAAEAVAPEKGNRFAADREAKRKKRIEPIRRRAEEMGSQLGGVRVVESVDEVTNEAALKQIAAGNTVPGWYDPKTEEVVIYLPHVDSVEELEKTIIHEVVAHKGVSALVKDGKVREDFYKKVWNAMSEDAKRHYLRYVGLKGDAITDALKSGEFTSKMRDAADEYIAGLSEEVDVEKSVSAWRKIVDALKEALRKMGIDLKISDEEIVDVLRQSYGALRAAANEGQQGQQGGTEGETLLSKRDKKTSFGERSGADSNNSSSKGLQHGGSARLSSRPHTHQVDVAKIAENTTKTKRSAQKLINAGGFAEGLRTEDAIRKVGNVLKLSRSKSSLSYYGDFEGELNVKGKIIRLRVSSHPANGQRMGNAEADIKVSLVIKNDDGKHIDAGEHNGYTEYVYNPYEVSPSDAANAIVKGVLNLIEKGEFVDETGKAKKTDYPHVTEDGRTLFSKKKNTNNLVAVHNISEDNLRKVLETGGLIMPSIAITDVDLGHSGYGEISLLFDKETIDPSDRRNKVYGGDAWTSRHPQLVPKLNGDVVKSVRDKVYSLLDARLRDHYRLSAGVHPSNIVDAISKNGVKSYYGKEWMKIAYLLDNGKKIKVPMKTKDYGSTAEDVIRIAKERGLSLDDIHNEGYDFYKSNPDFVAAVQDAIIEKRLGAIPAEERDTLREMLRKNRIRYMSFDVAISNARDMERDLSNGGLKQLIDSKELSESVNKKVKTDNADYNKWVDDLFDGIVEKYGIRNNRDWYTPSGNSRSWEQLYDAATPANILRYMLAQNEQGGSGGLWDSNIMGASAETYESIDEIREKGKKRLRKVDSDEYESWATSVSGRFTEISNEFMTEAQKDDFGGLIDAKTAITNAVAKHKTANGIYKEMKKEYPKFTMEHARRVEDIVKEIQDYATTYFESKPRRIVGLNEVRKAVVPSNVSDDIREALDKNGIEVATYRKDNEKSRKRVVKKESDDIRFRILNDNQRVFVSNAARAVESVKQDKATPQQWLAMIQKQGGLKAGEDKWMGLSDWLGSSEAKSLTKQEVLDFINENMIEIEEVRYSQFGYGMINEAAKKLTEEASKIGWDAVQELYPGVDEIFEYSEGEVFWSESLASVREYEDFILDNEIVDVGSFNNAINETREQYTTEGLENKREIALVVPTIEPYNASDNIHFGDAGDGRAIAWVRFGETTVYEPMEDIQSVSEFHDPYVDVNGHDIYNPVGSFRNGDFVAHGKARNGEMIYVVYIDRKQIPVAHKSLEDARNAMNDYYKEHPRMLRKPVKVLVIDEIQSKRHQDGREKGYADTSGLTAERQENGVWHIFKNGEFVAPIAKWSADTEQEAVERYAEDLIPDAPFDKNWHELAMKRMLRLAAEEGYDKVAWTTGAQQAERYDLSKSVEHIDYSLLSNGHYKVVAYDFYGNDIEELGTKYESEQAIADVFGKEIARTIVQNLDDSKKMYEYHSNELDKLKSKSKEVPVDSEEKVAIYKEEAKHLRAIDEVTAIKSIGGEGLKIGGEGMKAFYDKMLPSFVQKYVKKWGAKVGEVELPDLEEKARKMWSVDVTPEMKDSVMEGQTMFRKVYHGSGNSFDRFDHSHMGEGEGHQAYGWGTYVTDVEGIAKTYASSSSIFNKVFSDANDYEAARSVGPVGLAEIAIRTYMEENGLSFADAKAKALSDAEAIVEEDGELSDSTQDKIFQGMIEAMPNVTERMVEDMDKYRHLYEVEIPDNNGMNYLPYDEPISDEMRKYLEDEFDVPGLADAVTGREVYDAFSRHYGGEKVASQMFDIVGIVGVEYPAEHRSGGRNDGAKNYVIFNEENAKIAGHTMFRLSAKERAWVRDEGLTDDSYELLSDVGIIGRGEVPQWMDPTLKEVYLENKAAFDAMASEVAEEDETLFARRHWFGGNSGYVGYSMSKRAAKAREEGRFPKTDFKKEYGLTDASFNALVDAGLIDNSEWHHTSKYGNKTTFYAWKDDRNVDVYVANKKDIDKAAKEIYKSKPRIEDFEQSEEGMRSWREQNDAWLMRKHDFIEDVQKKFEDAESAEETEGALFRFSKTPEEFDAIQKLAKENKGVVMPNLRDRTLNIVDVSKHWFTGNLKNARAEARKWATEEYVGKYFSLPDGEGNYTISSNAIKKYIDNSSIGQSDNPSVHLSVLTSLPRIIEESIDTEIHADYKKIDNSRKAEYGINKKDLLVHRMYGAVDIEGKLYRVKTTMYEFRKGNNSPHNYEVTKIELIEDSTASQTNEFSRPLSASTNSISVAKLLDGVVKSYDGSKKVLDESDNSPLLDNTLQSGDSNSTDNTLMRVKGNDGEGGMYRDEDGNVLFNFYYYYRNINGDLIPVASVYLNEAESQDVVNEVNQEIKDGRKDKRVKEYFDTAVERHEFLYSKDHDNNGNNRSVPNRGGNVRLGNLVLQKGKYFDNPSLYVKTERIDGGSREDRAENRKNELLNQIDLVNEQVDDKEKSCRAS